MKWSKRMADVLALLVLVPAVVLVIGARRGENPVGQQDRGRGTHGVILAMQRSISRRYGAR